jgi:hypothetical protein
VVTFPSGSGQTGLDLKKTMKLQCHHQRILDDIFIQFTIIYYLTISVNAIKNVRLHILLLVHIGNDSLNKGWG